VIHESMSLKHSQYVSQSALARATVDAAARSGETANTRICTLLMSIMQYIDIETVYADAYTVYIYCKFPGAKCTCM
jgi:hypothetical protein